MGSFSTLPGFRFTFWPSDDITIASRLRVERANSTQMTRCGACARPCFGSWNFGSCRELNVSSIIIIPNNCGRSSFQQSILDNGYWRYSTESILLALLFRPQSLSRPSIFVDTLDITLIRGNYELGSCALPSRTQFWVRTVSRWCFDDRHLGTTWSSDKFLSNQRTQRHHHVPRSSASILILSLWCTSDKFDPGMCSLHPDRFILQSEFSNFCRRV